MAQGGMHRLRVAMAYTEKKRGVGQGFRRVEGRRPEDERIIPGFSIYSRTAGNSDARYQIGVRRWRCAHPTGRAATCSSRSGT